MNEWEPAPLRRMVGCTLKGAVRLVPRASAGPGCSWRQLDGPFVLVFGDRMQLLIDSRPTLEGDELKISVGMPNATAYEQLDLGEDPFWREYIGHRLVGFSSPEKTVADDVCVLEFSSGRALSFSVVNDDISVAHGDDESEP